MKSHTSDLVAKVPGRYRRSARPQGPAARARRPRSSARLAIERLEDRQLMAAAFFAPAEPSGSVNVQLVPLANVAAGTQEIVTFGVPFTRGSVSPSQLSQVRVLKNGVEIPAFVEQLTPWRSIDDPGIDGQSVSGHCLLYPSFSMGSDPGFAALFATRRIRIYIGISSRHSSSHLLISYINSTRFPSWLSATGPSL